MEQNELRREIAKEVFLKLVLDHKDARQEIDYVKLAQSAFEAANAFLQEDKNRVSPNSFPTSAYIKKTLQ